MNRVRPCSLEHVKHTFPHRTWGTLGGWAMSTIAAVLVVGLVAFLIALPRLSIDHRPQPGPTEPGLESAAASCSGVVVARVESPRVGLVVIHVWGGEPGDVEDIVGEIRPAGLTYLVEAHRVTPGAVLAAAISWVRRVRFS